MVGRCRDGARRAAPLLAVALLLGASAPAAAMSDAPTDLGPSVPAMPTASQLQHIHALVEDATPPSGAHAAAHGPLEPAAAGSSETYHDYCDDAPNPGDDLRRVVITRFPSSDTMRLDVATCGVVTAEAMVGGISLVLGTPDARTFLVTIRQVRGAFLGSVVETTAPTPDIDPPGVVRHTGTGWLADDGHGAAFEFPLEALDAPETFQFWLESRDGEGRVVDTMPQPDEVAVGTWPGSCQRRDVFRATVAADPDHLDLALTSARRAGLTTSAVNGATATFDVTLRSARHATQLAALPGIATVTASEVFEATPTVAAADAGSGAGTDAWWHHEVRADAARGRATGAGVTIGVVDNGVDGTRSELGGRVGRGHDVVRSRMLEPGENSDRGGHGTLVAGVAAAESAAVAGIAPRALIRPYQVFDFAGCASANAIATAIDAAIDDGTDVLNLSLGSRGHTSPILGAALDRAAKAGILVVAAAGNDALVDQPSVPAEHRGTVAVGATGPTGALAPYSNRADWVELVAPGGAGTTPTTGIATLGERDGYAVVNGTSFAAPIVAGAAALHLELSGATAATVRADLGATARDLGRSGRDPDFGFGMVDVQALLERAVATSPTGVRPIASACADAPWRAFPDVPGGNVHADGIACIAHHAVAGGYPDGTFRPGVPVDRGQMATFVANTILASGGSLPPPSDAFSDVTGTAHEIAIRRLAAAGIVNGVTPDRYEPAETVTRAQMATFLVRALEYRTGESLAGDKTGFVDVAGSVHEATIGRAATAGLTGGATRDTYRPEGPVTRGQLGSFLARTLAYLVDTGITTS